MIKWGPIEIGKSLNFYLTAPKGSKEQITLKSGKTADYYCFQIVVEGEDTVKMLPLNTQYDANLIKDIETCGASETTLCTIAKVGYTKKDGTQGGKLQFSILSNNTAHNSSDDSPPLEEYLKDAEAGQTIIPEIKAPINANKTQSNSVLRKDGQTMGMCFKIACDYHKDYGDTNVMDDVKSLTRTLYKAFNELMSE